MKIHSLFPTLLISLSTILSLFGQNTSYGTLYNSSTFDAKSIATTLPVGSIAASVDVSPMGGALYTIPIAVPPGTNGVVPQLSVMYNSTSGDGPLGRGWSLAGLSAIVRTGLNKYFDNEVKPIQLNFYDKFSLDGARLIYKTGGGAYGYAGATYSTENDNFAQITAKGTMGNAPEWFEVFLKDGTKMEFGNTSDSRFLNQDGTVVLAWKLNKIKYTDGNYIEYKYVTTDGDSRIDEINYTGNSNTGLLPYNKLKFNYSIRFDPTTVYEAQTPIKRKYLLDNITITAESSTAFKTYEFKYAKNNTTSFLIEVKEKGSNGTYLNSSIFKYGDEPTSFPTPSNSSVVAGQHVDIHSGDFDADGYSDIMAATRLVVNNQVTHTEFKIYKRTATNSSYSIVPSATTNIVVNGQHTVVYGPRGGKQNSTDGYNFLIGDFTGDAADDIVVGRKSSNQANLEGLTVYQSNNGTSFTPMDLPVSTTYSKITAPHFINIGDFDGDGVMDILTILRNNTSSGFSIRLYNGASTNFISVSAGFPSPSLPIGTWDSADRFSIIDFNGDGKSDIMVTDESITEIFTINNGVADKIYGAGFPTKWHQPFFGDFNGDRKTDMLIRSSTSNNNAPWQISISNGVSFVSSDFTFNHTPEISQSYSGDELLISDYNGDGKMDIGHGWQYSSNSSRIDMYYSKSDAFFHEQYTYSGVWTTAVTGSSDMNSDGRSDWMLRNGYQNPFYIFTFKPMGKELLVEKLKNGIGHVTEFSHKRMSDIGFENSFYNRGNLTPHPLNNIQFPLYLVYELNVQNGVGYSNTVRYNYEEAKLHREGKGLLGFKKITAYNLEADRKTTTENEFNTTFYAAAPYKTQLKLANNTLLNEVTNTNQFVNLGSKRFWVRVNSSVVNKAFEGITVTTTNTFDSYGNITLQTVATGTQSTTQISTSYGTYGTPVPARPTSVTVTNTRSGQSAYALTTTMAYNTLGQLTSKTEYSGLANSIVTTYSYNNNLGNLTGMTVTPGTMTPRTTAYTYDTKGRFALTETNQLGQTSSATFDAKWGKPLTVTGVDGLTTYYNYDAFGRKTYTTLPTSMSITEIYGWDVNATEKTVHYHSIAPAGKPDVKIWYDVLDREVKKQTEGFQSQWITEKKTYDERGRLATSTAPYKSGETLLTTTHVYDTYDRLISEYNTLGTTTYAYVYNSGNLTTTITNPASQVRSTVTDATGKMTSATDYGGTLNYTYNSQGNLTQVKLGTSPTLVTNVYDSYGRQTQMTDIDAGITQYAYNAAGEMTSQTNANNQTHNMTYDIAGRLTQRVGPEGTTTYEYFPSGTAAVNKMKKITGFAGNTEEFTYDTYGRRNSVKETIDGNAYTTNYTYNVYGDIFYLNYASSGFALTYFYDTNGYLDNIKRGTTTLFTNNGMNGFNQYTNYTLGNGKTSQNTFYFGIPTRYYTSGVQDLNLTWNYTSMNLTSRYDAIKNKTESFTYDNLNRLSGATVAGQSAQTVAYAANGNITSKTSIGTYSYASGKIHAVESITNPSGTVPTSQQEVYYTAFFQPSTVTESGFTLDYTYGADYERIKGVLKQNGNIINTRYYLDGYEIDATTGTPTKYIHYVTAGQGIVAIVVIESGTSTYNYVYTDHLGSILTVTNSSGTTTEQQNFDAWGRKRNVNDWTYNNVQAVSGWLYRGYTAHEQLAQFNLVNMNGRLYDPLLGRMLSVDNYVQSGGLSTQGYNRYSYANGNPLKFTDPTGEIVWAPIIIGAIVGAYMGGSLANNDYNPVSWNYNSGRTWSYMAGGAIVGAASGYVGGAISTSGIPMANTAGIAGASLVNSIGTNIYTDGETDISISLGAASFNISQNDWGYIGEKGNSDLENIGYGFGALANVSDFLVGFRPGNVELQTENLSNPTDGKDLIGHSQLNHNGNVLIDFGPTGDWAKFEPGRNDWISYSSGGTYNYISDMPGNKFSPIKIQGVNVKRLYSISAKMNSDPGFYQVLTRSCSSTVSRALTLSGVPSIGIHPYILHAQIYLRSIGVRPALFSHYLYNH